MLKVLPDFLLSFQRIKLFATYYISMLNPKFYLFSLFLLCSPILCLSAVPIPAPPAIAAEAFILQDFHSGRVIAEHAADTQFEPASLTKMMTAYVIFHAIDGGKLSLHDEVTISKKAWRNPGVSGWMKGSRMFVEVGSQVQVKELLYGLLVQSGNDAAVALAEHLAGTEAAFVQMMNEHAAKLGLENTLYQNCTGWPAADHYSSARDVATLGRALIEDFPELYNIFSEKRFTYNKISQTNRNALLWKDESVDGIKTGATTSAGYCLAASAEREGMRLISVVMGAASSESRNKYSQSLLDYGFLFYETHRLFSADTVLKEARVWRGSNDHLSLGVKDDVYVTIPRGEYENLRPIMNVRKSIYAPVSQGDPVGYLDIYLGEASIWRQDLVALHAVERGNFLQRLADQVAYILQ